MAFADPRIELVAHTLVGFKHHPSRVKEAYARQQPYYDAQAILILRALDRHMAGHAPDVSAIVAATANKSKPRLGLGARA